MRVLPGWDSNPHSPLSENLAWDWIGGYVATWQRWTVRWDSWTVRGREQDG